MKTKKLAQINHLGKKALKGLQIGVLSSVLATGTTITTACDPVADYQPKTEKEQTTHPENPYTVQIGDGAFVFHNYIGKEPDIVSSTAKNDVNRYLSQGITYLQNELNTFSQSLAGRPELQRYFAQFSNDLTKEMPDNRRHPMTDAEKMDYVINYINEICEPVLTEVANNISTTNERETMAICYHVLANEAYKEGLGENQTPEYNACMNTYRHEANIVKKEWSESTYLNQYALDRDIEFHNCYRTSVSIIKILDKSIKNLRKNNSLLKDITTEDLQSVISLSLNANSLAAMHDYTATMLKHTYCNMDLNLVSVLESQKTDLTTNELSF